MFLKSVIPVEHFNDQVKYVLRNKALMYRAERIKSLLDGYKNEHLYFANKRAILKQFPELKNLVKFRA